MLEDETRALSQTGLVNDILAKTTGLDATLKIPQFFATATVKPFIDRDLMPPLSNPILFQDPRGGGIAHGYPASLLADLCATVLDPCNVRVLTLRQKRLADRCELLVRGFPVLGLLL